MITVLGKSVGNVGYGLMGLTWRPNPVSTQEALKAMRTALQLGANFWNGGELYGPPDRNSLQLLAQYFTEYPEDADKVVISIKGGAGPSGPDGSEAGVRRSVDNCLKLLDGKKKLDIFECARVDPKVPVEESIRVLATYVKEGKIGGISLSEVRADTIRRAANIHPICAVEVEVSLWSTDPLTNGIASTCRELNIPLVAYSPLGRGFLTGDIRRKSDLPNDDMRHHLPRFQEDVFEKNLELVDELTKISKKKGCTGAQLALAWVKQLNGKEGMPAVIPIPGATTESRIRENMQDVTLSKEDLEEIDQILGKAAVIGARYPPAIAAWSEY